MFSPDQYELLDFGDGRRLERLGPYLLDRPCPAVEDVAKADPAVWEQADARFERIEKNQGRWTPEGVLPPRWPIHCGSFRLELKPNEYGHLGVFAEQADNWDWIASRVRAADPPVKVLNLFAYTGGSTLAAAAAGAEVTHVDAARNTVDWARRNAELSGLGEAPIRWIAEDARKFVRRELKRASHYDAIVLDPPSYGHGTRGEVWQLKSRLWDLLRDCCRLMEDRGRFLLLTAHTPEFGPDRLRRMTKKALGKSAGGTFAARRMTVGATAGRQMPGGVMVRWEA